ncbi:DUF4349 domain-containing protein [Anaeropeptidivorans aminofermentans]|jgi:hypothetical protein|uniref:DUF4349 domain-containing protein n=1 Tax=Anaeropeptidivorans aminofermentans TaxID=2934315 RepID=UPI002024D545|nr:DUF4349 domain-containing protein [Anaeropeptidivorans aminofermentans]MBE6013572.1 DUF4349 domain-containing protein [Lachnospiraceae bacterium]
MKKTLFPVFLAALILISGCGSKSNSAVNIEAESQSAGGYGSSVAHDAIEAPQASAVPEEEKIPDGSLEAQDSKIIKTGNMSISVTNFDEKIDAIKSFAEENGGYIQNSNIYNRTSGGREYRSANFTLRIPAENYDLLKEYLISLGKLEDYSDQIDDVTNEYYDIESRLNTKRREETRLLELLDKADKIEDIITIEARLSEVRSDIEIYEMRMKGMDELVSYSTLYLNVKEDLSGSIQPVGDNLGSRILSGLKSSVNNTVRFFESLIVGIAYAFVPLVSIGIIIIVGLFVYKRTNKKKNQE